MTRSLSSTRVCTSLLFVASLMIPSAAFAQGVTPGTRLPVAHEQVISANPFLLMVEYFNVEFERKHTETRTWGISGSSFGFDDADYRNVQAFYRYYPQAASLTGFYIGGRGGVHRVSDEDASGTAFGLGFEIGYGWLFGRERNFAVSLGAGVTRLFGGDTDASVVIPTFRLVNVGWSF